MGFSLQSKAGTGTSKKNKRPLRGPMKPLKIISLKKEGEYPRRIKVHCNHKHCITRNYMMDFNIPESLQS